MWGGVVSPFTAIGTGNATVGFWLGNTGSYKLIVAPKSTETTTGNWWGSYGITRGTNNTTDGLTNTNTLAAFGSATASGHPISVYCRGLTTGGYNTWYLPADKELLTCWSNHGATPFATGTTNQYAIRGYWSSTESNGKYVGCLYFGNGQQGSYKKNYGGYYVRAVRRSLI
jgi:hypothetical protein